MKYYRGLDCIIYFLLFQSNDKTAQECASWCDRTGHCNGFAVVDPSVRPGIQRCYLKHALIYSPPLPDERATVIYYRLTGLFNIRGYTMRGFWHIWTNVHTVDKSLIIYQDKSHQIHLIEVKGDKLNLGLINEE